MHDLFNLKCIALLLIGPLLTPVALPAQEKSAKTPAPHKWAEEIAKFEETDKLKPPPKNAILFAGSSSMVFWNIPKSFPDLPVINRGFGGSQLRDSVYYAPRIILKHEPRIVVVYAGDNDLTQGITPKQLRQDFINFVKVIHDALPKTRILYVAIKPSTKRWNLFDKQQEANRLIEDICKKDDRLQYVDIVKPMLGADGKPRPELLRDDGLHLNNKGYELWTSILKPMLEQK